MHICDRLQSKCSVTISPHLLHTGGLVEFSLWCPNLWQLWHLSEFGMHISTLIILHPIFILVRGFGVLKLRIYVC